MSINLSVDQPSCLSSVLLMHVFHCVSLFTSLLVCLEAARLHGFESVYFSLFLFVCMFAFCLFIHLPVFESLHNCLGICWHVSVYLFAGLCVYRPIRLFCSLSVCLSVCQLVSLSVCSSV